MLGRGVGRWVFAQNQKIQRTKVVTTKMNQEIRRIRQYLGSPSAFGLLSVMACDFWISKTVGHRCDLCFLYVITSDECKPRKLWPHLPSGSTVGAISAMVTASNLRSGSGCEIFHKTNESPEALSLPTQSRETSLAKT